MVGAWRRNTALWELIKTLRLKYKTADSSAPFFEVTAFCISLSNPDVRHSTILGSSESCQLNNLSCPHLVKCKLEYLCAGNADLLSYLLVVNLLGALLLNNMCSLYCSQTVLRNVSI